MMSPFQLDSKFSGAGSTSSSGVDFEAAGKALAAPVDRKLSFAALLGNAKKETPLEPRGPSANPPARASVLSGKLPHTPVAAKLKLKDHAPRATASNNPSRAKAEVPSKQPNSVNSESRQDDTDREQVELPDKKQDAGAVDMPAQLAGVAPSPLEEVAPVALFIGVSSFSDSMPEEGESAIEAIAVAGAAGGGEQAVTPVDSLQAGATGQTQLGESLATAVSVKDPNLAATAKTGSPKEQKGAVETQTDLAKEKTDALQGDRVKTDSGEVELPLKHTTLTAAAAEPSSGLLLGPSRAEKNAAALIGAVPSGDKPEGSNIFNNIENIVNKNFKKVDPVVGVSIAQANPAMSSTLLDLSEASRTDVPASEAVARVNLVQVVDEVAAITERMRVSGQHRCVVDFDVAGHGSLRVEVVRRADQLKTVFSTDSEALRLSLEAALDRSDRPGLMSTSFDWQGASSDSSGRGQSGTQADADSRQNTYFKAESVSRTERVTPLPPVSADPVSAPLLADTHRLQLFA